MARYLPRLNCISTYEVEISAIDLPLLHVNICQGVGGTLDTIAGTVKRAPYFFRKTGTEW
ncbi:MAG: WecB/TagA/CpsF family glycosyltransferase, partial [candidate division WOR-3 bacterium]